MNDLLYCCTMRDKSEFPDAAAELLSGLGYELSSWKNAETKEIHLTLYFQDETACREACEQLKSRTEEFASFGVVLEDLTCHTLKKEDWAEVWKLHFKPLVISDRLAFTPSWEKFQPKEGQLVITLDPGMSFGTGQHATTKFCLSSLDRFILELKQAGKTEISMLDAGSGSGILAIAAKKLGCARVDAFDIDPETVPIMALVITATLAGPPLLSPQMELARSMKNAPTPVFSRKDPKSMNRKMKVAEAPTGVPKIPSCV